MVSVNKDRASGSAHPESYGLMTRAWTERRTHEVSFRLADTDAFVVGRLVGGRINAKPDDASEFLLMLRDGQRVEFTWAQIDPQSVELVESAPQVPPLPPGTLTDSSLARARGWEFLIRSMDLNAFIRFVREGQLESRVYTQPDGAYVPNPGLYTMGIMSRQVGKPIAVRTPIQIVFPLEVLDGGGYFANPGWDYGTQTSETAYPGDFEKLNELFWKTSTGVAKDNEVIFDRPLSAGVSPAILVPPGTAEAVLKVLAEQGLSAAPVASLIREADRWPSMTTLAAGNGPLP